MVIQTCITIHPRKHNMHHFSTLDKRRFTGQALATLCLLWALAGPLAALARAQTAINVLDQTVEHEFKGPMTFSLSAESSSEIQSAKLFYRVSGEVAAHKVDLEFDPASRIDVEHTVDMSDDTNYQPPMITFTYWWVIEDQAGNRVKTDPTPYLYSDTRYDWQTLKNDQVQLYWTAQDAEFGQRYYDRAVQAATDLSTEFGLETTAPIVIVIYNSHQEFMSVLQEASAEWTGAVNFGDSGMIVIGLGQESWMTTVIPHELTHAMLHQITKPPFGEIPRWLHEGLAMRSEGGMGREERVTLEQAIRDDTLISLRVLNSPFPDQRERAILSYAESNSLVEFIVEEHGPEKLGELLSVFAVGAHYDDAMLEVFGVDMDGIEDQWRAYIGARPRAGAQAETATPLPTATTPATATPAPTTQSMSTETATPEATPTSVATPMLPIAATATALAAQPQPTATSTPADAGVEPSRVPPVCQPCLGLLPALAVLAIWLISRPRPVP
jgi:hypothetical protein